MARENKALYDVKVTIKKNAASSSTQTSKSSVLGTAVLGKMLLGKG